MVELPEQEKFVAWLFPDNIVGTEFDFLGVQTKKSKSGREFVGIGVYGKVQGSDGNIYDQDCFLMTSLIKNYKEFKASMEKIQDETHVVLKIVLTENKKLLNITVVETIK